MYLSVQKRQHKGWKSTKDSQKLLIVDFSYELRRNAENQRANRKTGEKDKTGPVLFLLYVVFKEQDQLQDEGGKTIDTGQHVAEHFEEVRLGCTEHDDANYVHTPGDLEGSLAAFQVSQCPIDEETNDGQSLRENLL